MEYFLVFLNSSDEEVREIHFTDGEVCDEDPDLTLSGEGKFRIYEGNHPEYGDRDFSIVLNEVPSELEEADLAIFSDRKTAEIARQSFAKGYHVGASDAHADIRARLGL